MRRVELSSPASTSSSLNVAAGTSVLVLLLAQRWPRQQPLAGPCKSIEGVTSRGMFSGLTTDLVCVRAAAAAAAANMQALGGCCQPLLLAVCSRRTENGQQQCPKASKFNPIIFPVRTFTYIHTQWTIRYSYADRLNQMPVVVTRRLRS